MNDENKFSGLKNQFIDVQDCIILIFTLLVRRQLQLTIYNKCAQLQLIIYAKCMQLQLIIYAKCAQLQLIIYAKCVRLQLIIYAKCVSAECSILTFWNIASSERQEIKEPTESTNNTTSSSSQMSTQ